MYQAAQRNLKSNIYIARFHNIYGPYGTWQGGREKAPAAICRKVAQAQDGSAVKIWGDGKQTRSFTYIDDCLEGVRRLVNSDCHDPLNIGSDEMVSINELTELIIEISGKRLYIEHEDGPLGVRGRTSDNRRIVEVLGWKPSITLREGIEKTYHWINKQVNG
jgi:GDP-D-mannose 3', 5'-epimerase